MAAGYREIMFLPFSCSRMKANLLGNRAQASKLQKIHKLDEFCIFSQRRRAFLDYPGILVPLEERSKLG